MKVILSRLKNNFISPPFLSQISFHFLLIFPSLSNKFNHPNKVPIVIQLFLMLREESFLNFPFGDILNMAGDIIHPLDLQKLE